MDDRELDLDALERIASAAAVRAEPATAEYSMMRRAQELLAAHITASTVLKLIALARRAAAPEPLRVAGEEVERLCKRLDERMVGVGCNLGIIDTTTPDPDCAEAAAMIRRLALIEPSAGKDFGADLSQLQPAESGEGTQPSPTKDTDRACDYIRELANDQVGCGLDPIGFLIASHGAVRGQRDTAQELVRAWEGAVSSLEAHIMDRAAMKDPANPETYLSILRSEIAGVQRRSEQCLASRWHDYKSQRSRIEALEAERDALLAGGVKPSPAADDGLSDSHEQVVEQQRSEPISSPSDAQSVRPDGGEG